MIRDIELKVCGLRRVSDARRAAEAGADFLGFILHPRSPRFLPVEDYLRLGPDLPVGPARVAVMVEPSPRELETARSAGFERFQIHARHDLPVERVREWSAQVGAPALWLAAKRPPTAAFPSAWLELADTFLVDTFHAEGFGGSGRTGDWGEFARLRAAWPMKRWILAGGLTPENIVTALARSGARVVDVNSGVEDAPGEKSAAKLDALVAALGGAGRL